MIGLLDDDSTTTSSRALLDLPGHRGLVVADWAAASRQGRTRVRNEDAWLQRGSIFALADGMGGLEEGHAAAVAAVEATVACWFGATQEISPAQVAHVANDAVRVSRALDIKSGCTLSALRIARDQATVVNVGDSRVYRIRNRHAALITRDHNLRTELLAAGILPQSARSAGALRALTSHLGMDPSQLSVDVRSVSLAAGDRIVLCTDGVHSMAHSQLLQRASGGAARTAADTLTTTNNPDDATAIVIDIGEITSSLPHS